MSKKPWTQEQVDALNAYQKSGRSHPYTCGGNRTDSSHLDGEGVLIATPNGWVCPYCDYRQDWAHDSALENDPYIPPTDHPFQATVNLKCLCSYTADAAANVFVIRIPAIGQVTQCRKLGDVYKAAQSTAQVWLQACIDCGYFEKSGKLVEEVERLKTTIRIAERELDSDNRIYFDPATAIKWALIKLRECLTTPEPDEERDKWFSKSPSTMSPKELVDRFASTYQIHSNPRMYNGLKAGYDEILARLLRLEALEASKATE